MIWMDGRAHPSDLAPHTWGGFSTGKWERNALVGVDDAHQDGLAPAQWRAHERPDDDDGAVHPAWRLSDGGHARERSGVPERAVHSHHELRPEPDRERQLVGLLRPATDGGRAARRVERLRSRTTCRATRPTFRSSRRKNARAARGGPRRRRDDLSRVRRRSCSSARRPRPTGCNRAALEPPRSENHRRAAAPSPAIGDIRVVPVQGNVYLLAGAGGNMAVQIGEDGVLLVDTGTGTLTDKVIAADPAALATNRFASSSTPTRDPIAWAATRASPAPAGAAKEVGPLTALAPARW